MAYVTIREVAQRAGVSVSTVSRALNHAGRVSRVTEARIEQIAKELDYIPDSRARAMRSSRTKTVGLLVPDIRNGYFADLAYAIQDTLFKRNYNTFIGTSSESGSRQDAFIMSILSQRIDGAIIVPQGEQTKALRQLVARGLPVIFVDRHVKGMPDVPVVDSDPFPGMESALRDVRDHGFSKVGYVSGPVLDSPSLQERELAFRQVASRLFGEENLFVESTSFDQASCASVLHRMSDVGADAMIFGYSPDAVRAMSLLNDTGATPGEEMSMISFDDLDLFSLSSPKISVISQQVQEIGHKGARLFLDMLAGKEIKFHERVKTIYIPRGSLGTPRIR